MILGCKSRSGSNRFQAYPWPWSQPSLGLISVLRSHCEHYSMSLLGWRSSARFVYCQRGARVVGRSRRSVQHSHGGGYSFIRWGLPNCWGWYGNQFDHRHCYDPRNASSPCSQQSNCQPFVSNIECEKSVPICSFAPMSERKTHATNLNTNDLSLIGDDYVSFLVVEWSLEVLQ